MFACVNRLLNWICGKVLHCDCLSDGKSTIVFFSTPDWLGGRVIRINGFDIEPWKARQFIRQLDPDDEWGLVIHLYENEDETTDFYKLPRLDS